MKRGQAAIEFLATYGFVLLVGFFSITSLGLYGVLNPGKFLPDACVLKAGMSCQDSSFYTYDIGNLSYTGMGMIGMKIKNAMPQDITHAYVVIDPADATCGGYFGILASPKIRDTWVSGEEREVKYYLLDFVCSVSADCSSNSTYNTCYDKLHLCADPSPGACVGQQKCPAPYFNVTANTNEAGYACVNDNPAIGVWGDCYKFPSLSSVKYLLCDCVDGNCANKIKSFNCCDSLFASGTHPDLPNSVKEGLVGNPSFCSGYTVANTCPQGNKMDKKSIYDVNFYVYYKTAGSQIFHTKSGHIRVGNQGKTNQI